MDRNTPDEHSRPAVGGKVKRSPGRKGRKSGKTIDAKTKLERSRQSARECRARKKEKYQLLEEMVEGKEKDVIMLRNKLLQYKNWCRKLAEGKNPGPPPSTEHVPSESKVGKAA